MIPSEIASEIASESVRNSLPGVVRRGASEIAPCKGDFGRPISDAQRSISDAFRTRAGAPRGTPASSPHSAPARATSRTTTRKPVQSRDQLRAKARAAYAERTPKEIAARKAYLAAWYLAKRRGGVPRVPPVPQTREQRLARRAASERRRQAALTPEQRRAKRAKYRPPKPRPEAAPKFQRLRVPLIRVKPDYTPRPKRTPAQEARKQQLFVESTTCQERPAPKAAQTVDEFLARGGQVEVLPGLNWSKPDRYPTYKGIW